MQRNWIGRSTGAEVEFQIEGSGQSLRIFTTRPDTLFGATYMVVSPEHLLLEALTTDDQKDQVDKYVAQARLKSELDRSDLSRERTGDENPDGTEIFQAN